MLLYILFTFSVTTNSMLYLQLGMNHKSFIMTHKNWNNNTMPKLVDDAGHYWNSNKLQSSSMWTEYRWVAPSNLQGCHHQYSLLQVYCTLVCWNIELGSMYIYYLTIVFIQQIPSHQWKHHFFHPSSHTQIHAMNSEETMHLTNHYKEKHKEIK